MALSPPACPSHGGLMELLNTMDARRKSDPTGIGDVVAGKDNVPLHGLAPFQPTTVVEAGAPVQPDAPVHGIVEAPHHVDSCEKSSTPKKGPVSSTLVNNFCF
jgi:hypothetical protein